MKSLNRNMLSLAALGVFALTQSVAQGNAASSTCTPLKTNALEKDPTIVAAAQSVATQIIGNYDSANSPTPPKINQFWGPFNVAVLQEMNPSCQSSTGLDTAVQNSVTAQAVTAQTNKQVTASGQTSGTSLVQQVGVPQLLAFAIENGAITNNVSGTTMTLSTTPYAFANALRKLPDTQQNYEAAGWATRTGISASFNIGSSSSDPLASATRKQVSQWQIKAAFRDTSIRSSKVRALYTGSDLQKATDTYAGDLSNSALLVLRPTLDVPANNAYQAAWTSKLEADVAAASKAQDMSKSSAIAVTLLQILDNDTAYQTGLASASAQLRNNGGLSAQIKKLHTEQVGFAQLESAFEKRIADIPKGWNGDFAFSEQFPTTSSTAGATATQGIPAYYKSELDVTCEPRTLGKENWKDKCLFRSTGTFTMNFIGTFYPNPVALHETTFRGGQASVQGQWSLGQGFVRARQTNDNSQMTFALSANYERIQENKDQKGKRPDLAIGNIKLSIPISAGVAFPLSITIASAGEQNKEKYVHGNFGVTFDLDKLTALLRANNQ